MSERLAFGYGVGAESRPPSKTPPSGTSGGHAAPAAARFLRERPDWAYRGLLGFTTLLYIRPQQEFPALAAVPLTEIVAIAALLSLVVGRLQRGLTITRLTPELAGAFALGFVMLGLAPFSIWPGGTVTTFTELYIKVLLIFTLIQNTLTSPARIRQFTWLIVMATGYIAFRAVFDYARGYNLVENGRVTGAVGGMFGNPNDLALNLVAVVPLAVLLVTRGETLFMRLAAGASGLLMISAVIATHSRGGFLGLAAMLLILLWQMGRGNPRIIAGGLVTIVLLVPFVPASYWHRMASITNDDLDDTGSRESRRLVLWEAFYTFVDHPWTGIGAGQFQNYNPPGRTERWLETHNAVLQVAAEMGIFGLTIFLFLIGRALLAGRQARRLLPRALGVVRRSRSLQAPVGGHAVITEGEAVFVRTHAAAMTAAVAGWFFCAMFASVAYHWTFYYLLALAVAPREVLLDRLATARPSRARAARLALQEARA